MRLIFVAGIFAALASAATFACSSASPATATTGDAGTKSSSGSTTTSSGSTNTSSSSSSGDTTTPPGDDDDAGDVDATTTPPASDGGLTQNSDAGSLCDPDAYGEDEPNDTAATPNTLPVNGLGSFKFCGSVTSDNNDWVTFVMPANVHSYGIPSIKANGTIDVSGTIGGQPFDATQGTFPNNRQAGDVWLVKINTASTTSRSYQLTFQFQ